MCHNLPVVPQFYVTAPQPCPYLDGRMERKLFTSLRGKNAEQLNNSLSKQGFRRSQNVLYRPSCPECSACLSARIDVAAFAPSKSQRRCLNRNSALIRRATSPWATKDQYILFRRYLDARHKNGGMADMDVFEFATMIEKTPIRSRVIEYADPDTDALAAVSLTDMLEDGLSMVYSFYAPDRPKDGLGTYMILDHVRIAREHDLPYVYLGYWVPGSQKMGYKARFSGLEVYLGDQWQKMSDPAGHTANTHPLCTATVAEQVANIHLPDRCPTG